MSEGLKEKIDFKAAGIFPSVIITEYIAAERTAFLANEKEDQLSRYFHSDILKEAKAYTYTDPSAQIKIVIRTAPALIFEICDGGLYKTLWDAAETTKMGLDIDLKAVPIKQETIEICEYFSLNPYRLPSRGSLLIITEEEKKVCKALTRQRIQCAVIGSLNISNDKILRHGEARSFLNRTRLAGSKI